MQVDDLANLHGRFINGRLINNRRLDNRGLGDRRANGNVEARIANLLLEHGGLELIEADADVRGLNHRRLGLGGQRHDWLADDQCHRGDRSLNNGSGNRLRHRFRREVFESGLLQQRVQVGLQRELGARGGSGTTHEG